MFTGIIEQTGRVTEVVRTQPRLRRIVVDPGEGARASVVGDSIAMNGCCLTVAAVDGRRASFDVIGETLDRTTLGTWAVGDIVNMEYSATASSLLSGHIVQGHIDAVGTAERCESDGSDVRLRVYLPSEQMDCIPPKGSVAIDGVSLTVASTGADWFEVALIPTTLAATNLDRICDTPVPVNVETDCVVRAVVHYLRRVRSSAD